MGKNNAMDWFFIQISPRLQFKKKNDFFWKSLNVMSKGKQFRLYLLHFFKKFISPLWLGNTWRGNFLFPKDFSKKLYTFQLQGFELINTFQENCLEFPETSFRHIMSCAWPWLIKVFPEKNVLFKAILGKAFH